MYPKLNTIGKCREYYGNEFEISNCIASMPILPNEKFKEFGKTYSKHLLIYLW